MSSLKSGAAAKAAMEDSTPAMTGASMQFRRIENLKLAGQLAPELLDEKTFTKMLCLERKRTERSGRRFVLMLLESSALLRTNSRHAFEAFVHTLTESTRETDIKGWYKESSVFGVIFTEIGDGESKAITKVLLHKVMQALGSTMHIDDLNQIRLSFHVYPEDITNSTDAGQPDLTLYPDQTPEGGSKIGISRR